MSHWWHAGNAAGSYIRFDQAREQAREQPAHVAITVPRTINETEQQ
jgi:hypothetical protein